MKAAGGTVVRSPCARARCSMYREAAMHVVIYSAFIHESPEKSWIFMDTLVGLRDFGCANANALVSINFSCASSSAMSSYDDAPHQ